MQPKTTSKIKKPASRQKKEITFPFEKQNFAIIGAGIVVLIIGYFLMSQNSVDGFLPTVVAPIVLIIGYCVIIPYGILKKPAKADRVNPADEQQSVQSNVSSTGAAVSNIKTS
jgi:xanthine/uracil permease